MMNFFKTAKEVKSAKERIVVVLTICFMTCLHLVFMFRILPTPMTESNFVLHAVNMNTGDDGEVKKKSNKNKRNDNMGSLSCSKNGGPAEEITSEMIYWKDIDEDSAYRNHFQLQQLQSDQKGEEKYIYFDPDVGQWNNMRLAFETLVVLAISMGRTVVVPPHESYFKLFAIYSESIDHTGIKIISMTEFLEQAAMQGRFRDKNTGELLFPPGNETDWKEAFDEYYYDDYVQLQSYLRNISISVDWNPNACITVFPENGDLGENARDRIDTLVKNQTDASPSDYNGKPIPVDAGVVERLREHLSNRKEVCHYDELMQDASLLYAPVDYYKGFRLLLPFYSFPFYENWKQALWTKRFVRDHMRYNDEIFCKADELVSKIRQKAIEQDPVGNPTGIFHSFHIRRNDFEDFYEDQYLDLKDLLSISKPRLKPNSTIYIATDEKNLVNFTIFREHFDTHFLADFDLEGVDKEWLGPLDQLVASRGEIFHGSYLSTFTAYINRLRGYYSTRDQTKGYENGELNSFYFTDEEETMTKYFAAEGPFWALEFPIAWRDIDNDIQ